VQARLCQLSCSETLSWTSEPIVVCAVLRFQSRTCWLRFNRGIVRCSCFCGDSVTDRVVLNMSNLDSRFSESMVRDVHVAKVGSSCIPVCPWILHWTLSIVQAFAILHCCIMSTNSENRFLSLLRPGDVGRLKSGVFMHPVGIMTRAGNVLTRTGYHH
jgi:hypothetical protein